MNQVVFMLHPIRSTRLSSHFTIECLSPCILMLRVRVSECRAKMADYARSRVKLDGPSRRSFFGIPPSIRHKHDFFEFVVRYRVMMSDE